MPIECDCSICSKAIYFLEQEDYGGTAQWLHYETPEPWHDALPPKEIAEAFTEVSA